jgi:hypothetical protein
VQNFRQRLNGSGLARSRRSEQQKDPRRPALRRKPGLMHVDVRDNLRHGMRLPDHPIAQLAEEVVFVRA